jgi:hypothetical protein
MQSGRASAVMGTALAAALVLVAGAGPGKRAAAAPGAGGAALKKLTLAAAVRAGIPVVIFDIERQRT